MQNIRSLIRPFRIQYASNLFVHRGQSPPLRPVADNLALLGNIGSTETAVSRARTKEFLSTCMRSWKQILWVPATTEMGNNMAYWYEAADDAGRLVDELNNEVGGSTVTLVNQNDIYFPLDGVRILGMTGWSAWARNAQQPPALGFPTLQGPCAFHSTGRTPLKPANAHGFSAEEMEWLEGELRYDKKTPTVILSHGLAVPNMIGPDLPPAAYAQADLMTVYPFGILFRNEPCVKACLGGAMATASGTIHGRFHGVNAWKSYPAQPEPNATFRQDAFYEYSALRGAGQRVQAEALAAVGAAFQSNIPHRRPNAITVRQ